MKTFPLLLVALASCVSPAYALTEAEFNQALRESLAKEGRAPEHERNAQDFFQRTLEENFLADLDRSPVADFQGFHLPTLTRELRTVAFYWVARGFVLGSGETRQGGVHTVRNRRVIINRLTWTRTQEKQKPLLVLHEAIGALGYDDEDYQLSLALDWFARAVRSGKIRAGVPVRSPFGVATKRSDQEKVYVARNGGSSLVGGGGDNCEIFIKQALTEAFAREPRLLQAAVDSRIECDGFRKLEVTGRRGDGILGDFKIDRVDGRVRIRAQSMIELVGAHVPEVAREIAARFRRFVASGKNSPRAPR